MTDFSHEARLVVEAVQNAMNDVSEAAKGATPTPFQRAVIGGLTLIAHTNSTANLGFTGMFNDQDVGAARRAIAPFLDETPRPA